MEVKDLVSLIINTDFIISVSGRSNSLAPIPDKHWALRALILSFFVFCIGRWGERKQDQARFKDGSSWYMSGKPTWTLATIQLHPGWPLEEHCCSSRSINYWVAS